MKRNWFAKFATSLVCLAMLVGCGGGGNSESGSGTKAVTVNLGTEPPEMLSFMTTDSTSGNVLRHTMETLITLDGNDEPIPGVAKEVPTKENGGISEDGLTITFNLNPEAKWQDGTQVKASDFEYAWDQLFNVENGAGYATTWAPLIVGAQDIYDAKNDAEREAALAKKGYKADDEAGTFTVQLTKPYAYFVSLMSFYSFAPLNKDAYEKAGGVTKYGTDMDKFLGNGPYKFKEWNHEDSIVLEKNENYWNKDEIKIDQITFRMISDTNTALNEFENGSIDMIGLTGEQASNLKDQGKDVQTYVDGGSWYFLFNTTQKPYDNAKVRRALTLGVDAEGYIENIRKDASKVATAFTTEAVSKGEFTESLGNLYPRSTDYTEAKKLLEEGLAEEGMKLEDFTLTLLGDEGDDAQRMYAYFQEEWQKNLGITVKVDQVTFKTRIERMNTQDFDIVFAGWSPDYNDPKSYLEIVQSDNGNNNGKYSNKEYDALLEKADSETDTTKRTEYLKQAEELFAEECPVGPVFHRATSYICSDRLVGIQRTAYKQIDLRFADVK
ncbi:peptide ABC transporter substrate-binding protein [Allocoprobacillus halotolerans]|uniref:Peptide ABC transporter substrate-binding protein n=1 Tax=Allocoprobacillus halotolerans TaxID=2944914 RepID=A0ABY5I4V8_9FIRM|nr:peptide ABC transporter substrate-binding protein [Allocoprobacillus halotolerans]UTY40000.1 peptide ABC transporter substrate-binding protein [Allocoprobacillus halotolerans]